MAPARRFGRILPGRQRCPGFAGARRRATAAPSGFPISIRSVRGQRLDVVRRDQHAGVRRHRVGNGAGRGADHRQAVRDRLRVGHAVALEARRQHEQVGRRIERGDAVRRQRAENVDPIGKPVACDVGIELRRRRRIARAVAHDGQPPRQIVQRRQRLDQHVIALARHHRSRPRASRTDAVAASLGRSRRDRCPDGAMVMRSGGTS